jgi:uncharacterized protein (TIGR03083 family)
VITTAAVTRHRTRPRRPALDHASARRLAAAEYDRFIGQLRELAPGDWTRPTACPAWDIHAIACHVLGMAEFAASPVEQARQMRAAKRAKGPFLDALTALQVDKHRHRPRRRSSRDWRPSRPGRQGTGAARRGSSARCE